MTGYFAAVAAATVTFIVLSVSVMFHSLGIFSGVAHMSFQQGALLMGPQILFWSALCFAVMLVVVSIPFWILKSFVLEKMRYSCPACVLSGAVTGLVLEPLIPLYLSIHNGGIFHEAGFAHASMVFALAFMISGAVGGLSYWMVVSRSRA